MKKAIFFVCAVLVLMGFVSCNGSVNEAIFDNTIPIPMYFGAEENKSVKGLSTMSYAGQTSPFDDLGVAQGVMTTMPCISGLKTVTVKGGIQKTLDDNVEQVLYTQGMKCKLMKCQENSDGYYLYYNIYGNKIDSNGAPIADEEQWVGFFDYYYKKDNKNPTFSYRQGVFVTIQTNVTMFVIEWKDVEVNNINKPYPSFKVGQLKSDGSFDNNAWLIIGTADFNQQQPGYNGFVQAFPLSAMSNGTTFASIERASEGYSSGNHSLATNFVTELTSLTDTSPTNAYNIPFNESWSILDVFFDDSKFLTSKLSDTKGNSNLGYSSLADYNSISIMEHFAGKTDDYLIYNSDPTNLRDDASIYRYNNGSPISASSQFAYKLYSQMFGNNDKIYWTYCPQYVGTNKPTGNPILANVTNLKEEVEEIDATEFSFYSYSPAISQLFPSQRKSGEKYYYVSPFTLFSQFGGYPQQTFTSSTDADNKQSIEDYQTELCITHLKNCGITGTLAENYAKNLLYSEWNGGFYTAVTTENPSTFKTKFDTAKNNYSSN